MNQEQLENLPYPMFKTTEGEKACLMEALPFIRVGDYNYFLCHILEFTITGEVALELKTKVMNAAGEHYTLSDYLGLGHHEDDTLHAELRRIWIHKLLAYSPE